jgi:thimet oligopeptidase
MKLILAGSLLAATMLSTAAIAQEQSAGAFAGAIYAGAADAAALTARCDKLVAEVERRFAALEKLPGPHSVDKTLKAYDELQALSYFGGAEFYSYSQSADSAEKRTAGVECYTRLDEIGTRIGLSRPIYDRLKAIDASGADDATQHYLTETLAAYDRSGVGFDDAKRAQIKALQDELTKLGSEFDQNIANSRASVNALPSELAGMPQDWIDSHKPGPDGLVEITTDTPDFQPVMSYAQNDALREKLARVYYSRAYPANSALLGQIFTKAGPTTRRCCSKTACSITPRRSRRT